MFIRLAVHRTILFFSILRTLLRTKNRAEVFQPLLINGSALTFFVLEDLRAKRHSKDIS
jgi:hypothetical protein